MRAAARGGLPEERAAARAVHCSCAAAAAPAPHLTPLRNPLAQPPLGSYIEMTNIHPGAVEEMYKIASINLSPGTVGQVRVDGCDGGGGHCRAPYCGSDASGALWRQSTPALRRAHPQVATPNPAFHAALYSQPHAPPHTPTRPPGSHELHEPPQPRPSASPAHYP